MECVTLGTGGMMPMPLRLTTSVLVRRQGRMLMFDAGEGIQLALKRGGLGIRALDAVAITHLHADHVLGLPGILMFRAQNEDPGPLTIIGPPGIRRFIAHTLKDLHYYLNFECRYIEWTEASVKDAWVWNGARLFWAPLDHSTFCLGYRLEEGPRPGKFFRERAAALGVPVGPDYGRLQSGETITTPAGVEVRPADVLGPPRPGRVIAFATDTRPCANLVELVKGADIAFLEGMFALEHAREAIEKKHMTAEEAGRLAALAEAHRLVLVHLSPRYSKQDEDILAAEVQAQFERAEIGQALSSYAVPLSAG